MLQVLVWKEKHIRKQQNLLVFGSKIYQCKLIKCRLIQTVQHHFSEVVLKDHLSKKRDFDTSKSSAWAQVQYWSCRTPYITLAPNDTFPKATQATSEARNTIVTVHCALTWPGIGHWERWVLVGVGLNPAQLHFEQNLSKTKTHAS